MIIRIMRHGDAPFINGERQLSELGFKEAERMGQWLQSQSSFDAMLVSPLLRAQQTAEQVDEVVSGNYQILPENLLKPESHPKIATSYFEALDFDSILLVSHMPLVVNLLETWVSGSGRYFPTAAVATLEITLESTKLLDFTTPSDLL